MKFIRLHRNVRGNSYEVLVNPCTVSAVYKDHESEGSTLYFNFEVDGEQARVKVVESLHCILHLINKKAAE